MSLVNDLQGDIENLTDTVKQQAQRIRELMAALKLTCGLCEKTFPSKAELFEHMEEGTHEYEANLVTTAPGWQGFLKP